MTTGFLILIIYLALWISSSLIIFTFWENETSFNKITLLKFAKSFFWGFIAPISVAIIIGLLPLIAIIFFGFWFSNKLKKS